MSARQPCRGWNIVGLAVPTAARSQFDCRECWSEPELDRLCEASVAAQVERLARASTLQAAWGSGKEVSLHGWIYGLQDALLSNLSCTVSGRRQGVS